LPKVALAVTVSAAGFIGAALAELEAADEAGATEEEAADETGALVGGTGVGAGAGAHAARTTSAMTRNIATSENWVLREIFIMTLLQVESEFL